MELTDTALIEKWKTTHDPDAFTELVTRHSAMVYRAACRILRDTGHAEEVAQECFMLLAQKPATVRRSPAGWLHALAVSRAKDRLRNDRRRLARESRYADQAATICTPQWDDVQGYVDEAVSSLSEPLREAIIYRYLEGHSLDETAHYLSLSRSTVQARLEKAVGEIRRFLKRRGVVVPVGALIAMLGVGSAEAAPVSLTLALGKLALAGTTGTTTFSVASVVAMTGGLLVMKKVLIAVGILVVVAFFAKVTLLKSTVPASEASPAKTVTSPDPPVPVQNNLPNKEAAQPALPSQEGSVSDLLAQMDKAKKNCSISGIVVDAKGRPMDDLLVFAIHPGTSSVRTTSGADGHFELADLLAGQYHLALRKNVGTAFTIDNEEGTVIELTTNEHKTDVKLVYERFWTISGRILNSEGYPIANTSVMCFGTNSGGKKVNGKADGTYQIDNLADDTYHLTFSAKGYRQFELKGIKAGEDNVDVVLHQGSVVKVRVLDAATSRPIPAYEVSLYDTLGLQNEYGLLRHKFNYSMKTVNDSNGLYSTTYDEPFPFIISVRAGGYSTESQLMPDNDSLSQEGVVFRLQKGGDLHGFVRDSSGQPIPDAQIFYGFVFDTTIITIKTGSNGEFTLTGFPRQAQLVSVYHPSFSIGDITVPAKADLSKPVEIVLPQGGSLRGNVRVASMNDNATEKIHLSLFYPQGHFAPNNRLETVLPAGGGSFDFHLLQPGSPTLNVSRHWKSGSVEQKQDLKIPVVIEEGNVKEINVDFPFSTGVIEGVVPVNSTLLTGENKILTLKWSGISGDETYHENVARSGTYRIEGVSPGSGTLELSSTHDGKSDLIESVPVTLTEGQVYHHDFTAKPEVQQP